MTYDWSDMDRTDEWSVEMVDPRNPSISRGWLKGLKDLSVSTGYYVDTRMTATIETLGDDGYIENSQLRIWHTVPEWGLTYPLFTGYVTSAPDSLENGTRTTSYRCSSAMYAMQVDLFTAPFAINKGAKALDAMGQILNGSGRPYKVANGARDYLFGRPRAWKAADTKLSALNDIANISDDRLTVDGYGYVVIEPYQIPSQAKDPDYVIATDGGLVVSETIDHTNTASEAPGRYIVTHTNGDEVVSAYADVDSSNPNSPQRRGYTLATSNDVTDLTGGAAQAKQLATTYLKKAQGGVEEWGCTCLYFPAQEGDFVKLRLWGEEHLTFVKSAEFSPLSGTVKLNLKGV